MMLATVVMVKVVMMVIVMSGDDADDDVEELDLFGFLVFGALLVLVAVVPSVWRNVIGVGARMEER